MPSVLSPALLPTVQQLERGGRRPDRDCGQVVDEVVPAACDRNALRQRTKGRENRGISTVEERKPFVATEQSATKGRERTRKAKDTLLRTHRSRGSQSSSAGSR